MCLYNVPMEHREFKPRETWTSAPIFDLRSKIGQAQVVERGSRTPSGVAVAHNEPGTKLICHHAVQTEVIGHEEAQFLMMLHDKGVITGEELKSKLNL